MTPTIDKLTNADLIARLRHTCRENNRLLGELIRLLIGAEQRRLYLAKAYPSMFEFCRKEFGMSEGEAYRRTNAAKLVARFPQLLPYIERGDIHLTALVQLRDHFTQHNVDELVAVTKGRNKTEIAELVARLAPRPDVPARLRKVPQHDTASGMAKNERRPSIDPLSEARYRLQLTADRRFRDKLLRARDLMMHTNPNGDLAVVVERALDELLKVLEKRLFGTLSRKPASTPTETSSLNEDVGLTAPIASTPASLDPPSAKKKKLRDAVRGPGLARAATRSNGKERANAEKVERSSPRSEAAGDLRQRKSRDKNGDARVGKRAAMARALVQRTVLTTWK